ncbi:hypothetical protein [Pseudoalteromonas tunicata]|jgi:anti-sigma28 factor (negative regulator of flagellin synthesis)|uniref:Putative orphan protein n=1 Tax=Pseudoalteromonas tunicata D2 TaxID=87626 RepID=A4C7E4_9GAMM|nr:hypothetical protein [Pseudoalteromonas tunicata]ATC95868.1 hypothetical protein PTUN_a3560 [Pseudoalteromonas tunicata]AXT31412.1 hypothetical protein D1819_11675 [Pseudoalteromonas tunicata]EAR29898.1 putative orphan protein [Pseudoalteromonas tunicata D2]
MQINANSGVSALAYQKTQNTQPIQSQSASTNTLQSDKVTFSQQAMELGGAQLQRGGGVIKV